MFHFHKAKSLASTVKHIEAVPEFELEMAEKKEVELLTRRALKKWNQLDLDDSGYLDGEEVMQLAEWAWSSFRHGEHLGVNEEIDS